jgi:hypothetical protein
MHYWMKFLAMWDHNPWRCICETVGSCCAAFLLPCRTESCLKKCREDEYWMTQCIQLLGPCTPPLQSKSHFIHSVASGFPRGNQASLSPQESGQDNSVAISFIGVASWEQQTPSDHQVWRLGSHVTPGCRQSSHDDLIAVSRFGGSETWHPGGLFSLRALFLELLYGYNSALHQLEIDPGK